MSDDEKALHDLRAHIAKIETELTVMKTKFSILWHAGGVLTGAVGLFLLNAILTLTGK